MPLIDADDVVRIPLPEPGEWVEVRRRLSRGAQLDIQRAIVGPTRMRPGEMAMLDVAAADVMEAAEFAVLDVAIRRWSFDVPVTPGNIRQLDEASVEALKRGLETLYGARSDDERGNSGGSGATPSSDVEPSLLALDGLR